MEQAVFFGVPVRAVLLSAGVAWARGPGLPAPLGTHPGLRYRQPEGPGEGERFLQASEFRFQEMS